MKSKKHDYECKVCGYILSDDERDYNNGICNCCLMENNDNNYKTKGGKVVGKSSSGYLQRW